MRGRIDDERERRERSKPARQRAARRRRRLHALQTGAIGLAIVSALVVGGFLVVNSGNAGVSFAGDLRQGGRLDALSLPKLDQGARIGYSAFSDRPLVLNFLASWCPNCIDEMPGFEWVREQLSDRVGFLMVSQSDARSASIQLAHETGISYPAAVDASGRFFDAWGTLGMPTTVFIQPGGRVAYVRTGALDETSLRELIERYLDVRA